MILVIDNYDSFTFNLVQYLGELNVKMEIWRNDEFQLDQIRELNPDRILISPGPCTPKEAGISNEVIQTFAGVIPIFGVCLGHQCIAHSFGGIVEVNNRIMHGKVSKIFHKNTDVFEGMPNPFEATRYHSLVVRRDALPDCLEVTAETEEGEIMGIRHKELPVWGVQFHPESILTQEGRRMMENFTRLNLNSVPA